MPTPILIIIGRPNVGKSTLFNFWVGHRLAIESKIPGTTRDFLEQEIQIQGKPVILKDTAGLDHATDDILLQEAFKQIQPQIQTADLILFLVSAKDGITPQDQQIAQLLRKAKKPIILAAAQTDNKSRAQVAQSDFLTLGFDTPLPFSVKQNSGLTDLENQIFKNLPKKSSSKSSATPQHSIRLALIGRPNVGKSSLLNILLKQDRALVSDIPGTTRDLLEIPLRHKNQDFILIDTAGLRRPGKRKSALEFFSVDRTKKAIDHADVIGLVFDAHEGLTKPDLSLAKQILDAGRALFFIANKWDLLEPHQKEQMQIQLPDALHAFAQAPILTLSAKTGLRASQILTTAAELHSRLETHIKTSHLNSLFKHEPGILFLAQKSTNPPLFEISIKGSKIPHFSIRRRFENQLRDSLSLKGLPLKIVWTPKAKWTKFSQKVKKP